MKTAEAGGPRSYDTGKKIEGRKRHITTDTLGNMLGGVMHGVDVQDPDGAPGMIERSAMHTPPYPAIGQSWRRAWAEIIPFFAFPVEIRRIAYTTNAIAALTPSSGGQSAPGGTSPATRPPPSSST